MPDEQPIPPPGPEALAAQREALVERLAEGHWRLDCWPNQSYPWSRENRPTADAHRRGARRCLDGIAMAGLRLVPADTEPSDAEQAATWMHEAWHQAAERDREYQRAEALAAELAKTISNFEEHAEASLERVADLKHELEVLRRINRQLSDGNLALNQLVLDTQRERDEARAERDAARHELIEFRERHVLTHAKMDQLRYERRLLGFARLVLDRAAEYDNLHAVDRERLPAEAADIAQRIVDEIGHPVTDEPALGPSCREQIAALTADLAQARRDAASWEDWGRGWKTQAEANQVERDKAWADLDAAKAERDRRFGSVIGTEPVEVDP